MPGTYSLSTPSDLTEPQELSASGGLVIDAFGEAQAYANSAWTEALNLLDELKNKSYPIDWSSIEYDETSLMGLDGLALAPPDYPTIDSVTVTMPSFTDTKPTVTTVDVDERVVPEFTDEPANINIPEAPTDEFPTFDTAAPPITQPNIPTAPDYTIPPVPTIDNISIPSPPEYNFIDFDAEAPTMDLDPPSTGFSWTEELYTSDLKTAVESKLLTDVVNGGSGLDDDTEQAIYDRATSRQEDEFSTAYDAIFNGISARGSRVPPGALSAALLDIENKIIRTREDLNNDILI